MQAVVKTDKEVQRLKEDIEAKKWRIVADQMKSMKVNITITETVVDVR